MHYQPLFHTAMELLQLAACKYCKTYEKTAVTNPAGKTSHQGFHVGFNVAAGISLP